MSSPETTSSSAKGATATYLMGAFAVFAVLLSLIQWWLGSSAAVDPRSEIRIANTAEIRQAQADLTAKMGLNDKAKTAELFGKTAAALKAKKPAPSVMVVPGSPTQLKMAPPAAPAPAAAPVKK